MSLLAEPRTRSIVFAIGALVFLGGVAWVMLTRADTTLPDAAPAPAVTGEVVPYAPPVPGQSSQSSASPTAAPTATASPETPPTRPSESVKWTEQDVTRFLKAFNTINWQESEQVFIDRVLAAGAVPGSSAAAYSYPGKLKDACALRYCSSEFISANKIQPGDSGTVTAKAQVQFTDYGNTQTQELSCTLTLAAANAKEGGLFTSVACLGPFG